MTNDYLVASVDPLAIRYNDKSPMEVGMLAYDCPDQPCTVFAREPCPAHGPMLVRLSISWHAAQRWPPSSLLHLCRSACCGTCFMRLQNHHLASAFSVLALQQNNFMHSVPKSQYQKFRSLVIDLVLATDVSCYCCCCCCSCCICLQKQGLEPKGSHVPLAHGCMAGRNSLT